MRSIWLDTHDPSRIPVHDLPPGAAYDIVIAGAGLTGLTTAVELARAGQRVAVLEARTVGAVTTGNTTAKLTLLQGTMLSMIRRRRSAEITRAYVDANRAAQEWLLAFCAEHDVDVQRRPAITYATTDQGAETLRSELDAAREAGLDVRWQNTTELPFPVTGAVVLDDQAQFHPMEVLTALARELDALGGIIVEHARLTGAGRKGPFTLSTSAGQVRADRLVLATGIPVLDRGGHFTRMSPNRSYGLTFRLPDPSHIPPGMYISADSPTRTVRSVPIGDEELLLTGGNDHVTGRSDSPAAAVADLEAWTREHFPGAERTHAWAAQDYIPLDQLPLIGDLPGSNGTLHVGTGFSKWGMTNGVAAALGIAGAMTGREPDWLGTLRPALPTVQAAIGTLKLGAEVGLETAKGWAGGELRSLPEEAPAEGEGVVGRAGGRPVAVSTVDGRTCRLSAVCTHLGGVLRWNDAERSWDCPLHGSRFAADGSLLEGPAVKDLASADAGEDDGAGT